MATVYLSTGSNMGNKLQYLQEARLAIGSISAILKTSSIYETEPWGFSASENFYNEVVCIETKLPPIELIEAILSIEQHLGRKRNINLGYQSRNIDIDILFYDQQILDSEKVTIPHPKLHERLFVLVPLAEIAPNFIHPTLNKTVLQLIENCKDTIKPKKVDISIQ